MKLTYRQVLSRPDADGRCRVVLDVAWDCLRAKLATGVSCLPAHFSPEARQVVMRKGPDHTRLNNELAKVEATVNAVFTHASADNTPVTEAQLVAAGRAALGKKPIGTRAEPAPAATAPEFYALWQADHPGQTANSARRYKQVVGHLEAYQKGWPLLKLTRKDLLERSFVRVQYVRGEPTETVLPLYKVITTHTARHTGADLVMLGSGGDSNLKEKALGHAGVYGHDALERYGPALLQAWEKVLGAVGATEKNAPSLAGIVHQSTPSSSGGGMVIRRVSYR
jgi:hypothetical protein